jgi:hypothetical protein
LIASIFRWDILHFTGNTPLRIVSIYCTYHGKVKSAGRSIVEKSLMNCYHLSTAQDRRSRDVRLNACDVAAIPHLIKRRRVASMTRRDAASTSNALLRTWTTSPFIAHHSPFIVSQNGPILTGDKTTKIGYIAASKNHCRLSLRERTQTLW